MEFSRASFREALGRESSLRSRIVRQAFAAGLIIVLMVLSIGLLLRAMPETLVHDSWDADHRVHTVYGFYRGAGGEEIRDGLYMEFYSNGNPKRALVYRHGLLEGNALQWREDGTLQNLERYVSGVRQSADGGWDLPVKSSLLPEYPAGEDVVARQVDTQHY